MGVLKKVCVLKSVGVYKLGCKKSGWGFFRL